MYSENKLTRVTALFRTVKCGLACRDRRQNELQFHKSRINDLLSFVLGYSETLQSNENKGSMHSKAIFFCLSVCLFAIHCSTKDRQMIGSKKLTLKINRRTAFLFVHIKAILTSRKHQCHIISK